MPNSEKLSYRLLGAIISHPRLILLFFLLATGLLGWQARNFKIDASADTLLMRDDPDYIQTRVINQRFAPQEFLLVAYRPRDRPLFSEQTFRDLRSLQQRLGKLARVESVRCILNVPLFSAAGSLAELKGPSHMTLEELGLNTQQIAAAFRDHPLYQDLLINREQTVTALQVLFRSNKELGRLDRRIVALQKKRLTTGLSTAEEEELAKLKRQTEPLEEELDRIRGAEIKTIRHIISDYAETADIYLGGLHVLGYQLIRIIKNDLVVFGGAILVVICLILFLLFRRIRWVVIPIACCTCSVLSTMGLFIFMGHPLVDRNLAREKPST